MAKKEEITEIKTAINQPQLISCLRNERIIIRHINKTTKYTDPKHVLSGGMAEGAMKTYVVPRLSSGVFVNVLTNAEKNYLEHIMGLEHDALSIYNKVNNFWEDSNSMGISRVKLRKQDNFLDLSVPDDYIKYKILLANKNYICPSLKELDKNPKATYEYVIISEHDEGQQAASKTDSLVEAITRYTEFKDDTETLKAILELMDKRRLSNETKPEFLKAQIVDKIQKDSDKFLAIIDDPYFKMKILLKKSVDRGAVADRGGYFYYKDTDGKQVPLCESGQEPVLENAVKFLGLPRNQEIMFALQALTK